MSSQQQPQFNCKQRSQGAGCLKRICERAEIEAIERSLLRPWHYDHIVDNFVQQNRVQVLLNFNVDRLFQTDLRSQSQSQSQSLHHGPCCELSYSTVFVENSYKFSHLFEAYYQHVIVASQSEFAWTTQTCPVHFHRFSLSRFNQDLALIKSSNSDTKITNVITDVPQLTSSEFQYQPEELVRLADWRTQIESYLDQVPSQFNLLVANYDDGDLLMFMPKTLHGVIAPQCDAGRLKIYLDVYSFCSKQPDESGFCVSDGSYKSKNRLVEIEKFQTGCLPTRDVVVSSVGRAFLPPLLPLQVIVDKSSPDSLTSLQRLQISLILRQLAYMDVAMVRCGVSNVQEMKDGIQKYISCLVKPSELSQFISGKNLGVSGFGVFCPEVVSAAAHVAPICKALYHHLFGENVAPELHAVEVGIQIPDFVQPHLQTKQQVSHSSQTTLQAPSEAAAHQSNAQKRKRRKLESQCSGD